MQIVVISPESSDPREVPAMEGLFFAGLGRYHVRKPMWTEPELEAWLRRLPESWRPRIFLHQHHVLVGRLSLGGRHGKDSGEGPAGPAESRSCHGLAALRRHIGRYDSLIFGPVFPSLSKPGYGPAGDFPWDELRIVLKGARGPLDTRVLAVGGVTTGGLARCHELGFDGAAVIGAVWNAPDPVRAYTELRAAAQPLEAARHAA